MALFSSTFNSPLGILQLIGNSTYLTHILFSHQQLAMMPNPNAILLETQKQLEEYFEGQRKEFDLPLIPGGTPFQKEVWQHLQTIPYGKSISYQQMSEQMNQALAIRAIASANGKNPIPIIIPCHRVIGSNGKLTGYSGGLHNKLFLLQLEGIMAKELF
jgi:methylated-DNA-[protein]-cysteine S-methyltransferase